MYCTKKLKVVYNIPMIPKAIYWVIDYFYLFYGNLLMLIHKNPPKRFLSLAAKGKISIILIPGIANKWGFLKKLGDSISLKGHPVYIASKLKFNFLDIPTSSRIIREIIDKNNLKRAVIIGHSKGGLIGKYLLVHENKDNRIKGLIAIGTPFSGSRIVQNLPRKPYKELSPESNIIKILNSHKEVNSKVISIMPSFDNHVWHEKGSYLEGALNIKVPIKGHHKIVFDKDAINRIIKLLEEFK